MGAELFTMQVVSAKVWSFFKGSVKVASGTHRMPCCTRLVHPTLPEQGPDRGEIKMLFDVVGPSIHRIGSLSVHLLR